MTPTLLDRIDGAYPVLAPQERRVAGAGAARVAAIDRRYRELDEPASSRRSS